MHFSHINRLILASASPRRRMLLELIGLKFETIPSDVDETLSLGEDPSPFAMRMAVHKAEAVAASVGALNSSTVVLGADTIVVVDRSIWGKPADREDARRMLEQLSGRTHIVTTGYCLVGAGRQKSGTVSTEVVFKSLDSHEISAYLDEGEWHDKAGAYAVQGRGAFMVRAITGSYTNVVGLPLCEVVEALRHWNDTVANTNA